MIRRNLCIVLVATLISACGDSSEAPAFHDVEVVIQVPENTPTVYLTGNIDDLGPWDPGALAMSGSGRERTATVQVQTGQVFEYKITLGSWQREAVDQSDIALDNFSRVILENEQARHIVVAFKRAPAELMADWQASGVLGTLVYWQDVPSEFLGETRHVEVWLPPGYDDNDEKRYPVIYMHDGQNLFDPRIANTGIDWGVDEAMMRGADAGLFDAAIVVGAWSSRDRTKEYSPWHGAPQYARFLIDELMPRVDAEFRTMTGPRFTSTMGSSMGGLLSFYLVKNHPDVFGACGCVSSHFPVSEAVLAEYLGIDRSAADATPYVIKDIAAGDSVPENSRFYFDYGTETLDAAYGPTHFRIREWLLEQGRIEGTDFQIREYEGAAHNEAAWRARLDDQLEWLLGQ